MSQHSSIVLPRLVLSIASKHIYAHIYEISNRAFALIVLADFFVFVF